FNAVKVRAKTNIFDTTERDNMVNLCNDILNIGIATLLHKWWTENNMNHSISFHHSLDLVISYVTAMITDCGRIGMAGDGIFCKFPHIPKSCGMKMGNIDKYIVIITPFH